MPVKNPLHVLAELGLPQYIKAFHENAITAEIAPRLTDDDLKELGVTALGHRKQIIAAFGSEAEPTSRPKPAPEPAPPHDAASPPEPPRIPGSKAVADASWHANWLAWWMVIVAGGTTALAAFVSAVSLGGGGRGAVYCPSILAMMVLFGLWRRWMAAGKKADHAWVEHPRTPTDLEPTTTIARYKAPVVAAALNMFCVGGLGYMYLGQQGKALKGFGYGIGLLFLSGISLTVGDPTSPLGWLIRGAFALAYWLTVADAYVLGHRLSKGVPVGVNETGIGLLKPILGTGPQVP